MFEHVAFPFPKIARTFDYFFPQKKGSTNFFTMENLVKFSRYAPYLSLGIIILIFSISMIEGYIFVRSKPSSPQMSFYAGIGPLFMLFSVIQYFWWMGASLLAKLVNRSPTIPLVMSFLKLLKTFAIFCIVHFLVFIIGSFVAN